MPIKPIIGQEPLTPPLSLDHENDKFQNQKDSLNSNVDKPIIKPSGLSTDGSTEGNPVGVTRKYFDKISTEFGLNQVDELRKEFGAEWERSGFSGNFFSDFNYSITTNDYTTKKFNFTGTQLGFPIEVTVEPLEFLDDSETLYRRRERVFIRIPKADFNEHFGTAAGNKTFFDWFGEKVSLDEIFSDNVFEMTLPMNKRTTENFSYPMKISTVDIKGNYNYEIPNYEKQIANVHESLIQNLYALFSAIEYEDTSQNPSLQGYIDHATLDGKVDTVLDNLLKLNKEFDFRDASYSLYLEAWSRAMKILKSTEEGLATLDKLRNKFDHMVFPQSEKELFTAFGELIELFPMYVEMELSTDALSPMSLALEEMKLSLSMMTFLIFDELISSPDVREFVEVQETTFDASGDQADVPFFQSEQVITEWNRDSWDLITWFKNYRDATDIHLLFQDAFEQLVAVMGDGEFEFKIAMTPENELYRKLLLTIFESKLKGLVKDRFRSYQDILQGKKCASETLVYKIAKWTVDNNGLPQQLLQSFWIPNTGDLDVVKFFDTQVKYDKQYIYKINCFQLVYGTDYKYDAILQNGDGLYETDTHYTYQVTVETTPSVKLWEVPYYNLGTEEAPGKPFDITRITDKPPIFPDAQFVPYIGKSNKILITLNTNNGLYDLEPTVVNLSEVEDWQKIAENQYKKLTFDSEKERFLDVAGNPQTLAFESDDFPQHFEIFRTQTKPTRYTDFEDSLLTTLTPPISSFVDNIKSNTKYWYVFRVLDSHNHYSNPTEVYEVKMIENSGIIYPEITIKSIEELRAEEEPMTLSKDVQKYIQIKPSILQRFFEPEFPADIESAMDVEKPRVGVQDESVFDNGKKFKIRITSKHTGRKIDINLKFKHTHDKNLFNKKAGKK